MIISPDQFDFDKFEKTRCQTRRRGNQGTKDRTRYKDIISAFDIETTRIVEIEQSVMYIWQWAFEDVCVIGRTWDEFLSFAEKLCKRMRSDEKLVVFDHNLSYEFAFLKGIYDFKPDEVFCMDARKVLTCSMMDHIEFRCSYIHSNMSLAEYTSKMGVQHGKLSGKEFDYSKERYSFTPLTGRELEYCVNDVLGLVEAVKVDMDIDHDNLYTFPKTATGYVRRDAKKAMQQVWFEWSRRQAPTLHLYTMLREAFRGGNTHCNRFMAGEIIEDVSSYDRSSSYPDVMLNCEYPVDRFYEIGSITEERMRELMRHHRAIVMRVRFYGLRLKHYSWGCPYIPKDKCRNIIGGSFDNGRVLYADYLEFTYTDVDQQIIDYEYVWDAMEIYDCAYTRYGMLPQSYRDTIIEYYKKKTLLKYDDSKALELMRAKAKLNSLYGLSAQDPCKPTIEYRDGKFLPKEDETVKDLLDKDNRRRVLPPYQVGVWVTAHARRMLELGLIDVFETPGARFVYADTDSIKFTGHVDFSKYNHDRITDSRKNGGFAVDSKGNEHFTGVLEYEGRYRRFTTLGAKKYCYEDEDGKLHLTVSGVIKNEGAKELAAKGGIEAFKPSFIFKEAGGVEAVYNDDPDITTYNIDGHDINITSNVVLRESTYTLGITSEYEYLLSISNLTEDTF